MNVIEKIGKLIPLYRIHDREGAIRFFSQQLGLKKALEEGPFVHFADPTTGEDVLVLEESSRSHAQEQTALHRRTLLGITGVSAKALCFEGYSFDVEPTPGGLKSITLSVSDPEATTHFYEHNLGLDGRINFEQGTEARTADACDLEILQLIACDELNLEEISFCCGASFLSPQHDVLELTDPSGLQLWIVNENKL